MLFFGLARMPTQRIYKTNLDFEPTLTSLSKSQSKEISVSDVVKGRVTIYIRIAPKSPKTPVQITTNGFVQILGGEESMDEQIRKIIEPFVTTRDSQQFKFEKPRKSKGEKDLRIESLQQERAMIAGQIEEITNPEPPTPEVEAEALRWFEMTQEDQLKILQADYDRLTGRIEAEAQPKKTKANKPK